MFNFFKVIIVIYFFSTVNAYAYLDPYTGSIILSFLAGVFAFLSMFYYKIKKFFLRFFSKHKDKDNHTNNEIK